MLENIGKSDMAALRESHNAAIELECNKKIRQFRTAACTEEKTGKTGHLEWMQRIPERW
jgi:hypothetical protein